MNSRNSFGGTSTKQTEIQIAYFKDWLSKAW
jgi:argininosuccinate lyase